MPVYLKLATVYQNSRWQYSPFLLHIFKIGKFFLLDWPYGFPTYHFINVYYLLLSYNSPFFIYCLIWILHMVKYKKFSKQILTTVILSTTINGRHKSPQQNYKWAKISNFFTSIYIWIIYTMYTHMEY